MLLQAATAQRVKQVRLFFGLISLLISEQKKKKLLWRGNGVDGRWPQQPCVKLPFVTLCLPPAVPAV